MPSNPILTVFARSPDGGRGLARDTPVRWALEEVGVPYDIRRVTFEEMKASAHLARNPVGQIPTFEDGDTTLFESGAIVLHIAHRHVGLLPPEPASRYRAIAWMFAALTTVEPLIVEREQAGYLERDRPWFTDRQALMEDRIRSRLTDLSAALEGRDWLAGAFTAADILMVTVLRRIEGTDLLTEHRGLSAYVARGTERPAYARAFAAQRAAFDHSQREETHAH